MPLSRRQRPARSRNSLCRNVPPAADSARLGNPLGRKAISGKITLEGTPLEQGRISFEPLEKRKDGITSGAVIVHEVTAAGDEHDLRRPEPSRGGTAA